MGHGWTSNGDVRELTGCEGFPEEVLAAGFALSLGQVRVDGSLQFHPHLVLLRRSGNVVAFQRLVLGVRQLGEQLGQRILGQILETRNRRY